MTGGTRFAGAVRVEWIKFRSAPVAIVTSALLVLGVPGIAAASLAAAGGDGPAALKAAALTGDGGWSGMLAVAAQVAAAAGPLAFGVVYAWSFGRDFTQGTIVALFALPTGRGTIAGAKLVVLGLWSVCLTLAVVASTLATGGVLQLGHDGSMVEHVVRFGAILLLSAVAGVLCGLVATLARSYLAGIGAAIVVLVVGQVAVLVGVGGWFPFAAPGAWAAAPGTDMSGELLAQLITLLALAGLAAVATMGIWRRLRL